MKVQTYNLIGLLTILATIVSIILAKHGYFIGVILSVVAAVGSTIASVMYFKKYFQKKP